jgi:GNAT superfamily N-acetyltransferase
MEQDFLAFNRKAIMQRLRMRRILRQPNPEEMEETEPVVENPQQAPSQAIVPLDSVNIDSFATLMLDAYRGTIDYEGESFEDTVEELRNTLAGQYGQVILSASGAILTDAHEEDANTNVPAAAIIVTEYDESPFIAYVFTSPKYQHHGYATQLIERACAILADEGRDCAELAATVGSSGEDLYRNLGFIETP